MQKIEVRAWIKSENKIEQVYEINLAASTITIFNLEARPSSTGDVTALIRSDKVYNLDDVVLLVNTGLQDQQGVDIYEGDILLDTDTNRRYVVMYDQESAAFIIQGVDEQMSYDFCWVTPSSYRVIGNVYSETGEEYNDYKNK